MCGIAGMASTTRVNRALVERMTQKMANRGPDDQGLWEDANGCVALGHRRLSILDLSKAGAQPMSLKNAGLWIVYNGEIYNYLELKKKLESMGHRFTSSGDTEVILAAYNQWGDDAPERFVGMWAFAIWDEKRKRLFCSRDHFGIKPFYYWQNSESFLFASDINALLIAPQIRREPQERMLYDYLAFRLRDHTPNTMFDGIMQIPPAHHLVWENGKTSLRRYWRVPEPAESNMSFEEAGEAFRALFEESIKIHLRSDVPVGACLSGGLDSSALVCLTEKSFDVRLDTFSSCYEEPEVDERRFIDAVVQQTGVKNDRVYPKPEDVMACMPEILKLHPEPFASTSIISQYFVFKLIGEAGIKVAMDGQGADEMLGSYDNCFGPLVAEYFRKPRWLRMLKEIALFHRLHGAKAYKAIPALGASLLPPAMAKAMMALSGKDGSAILQKQFVRKHRHPLLENSGSSKPFHRFRMDLLENISLPALLHYEDINSMAFSVESRVPFLDHRLVAFTMKLPAEFFTRDGLTKRVLRKGLADVLPQAVAQRTDKLGFATPEAVWFREGLADFMEKTIRSAGDYPYFDADKVSALWDRFQNNPGVGGYVPVTLWRVFHAIKWLETHF